MRPQTARTNPHVVYGRAA